MDRRFTAFLLFISIAYGISLILALSGITGTINADLPDLWTPGYIWPVLLHTMYGVVLFAAIVITGNSSLRLASSLMKLSVDDIHVLSIFAGMLTCLGISIVAQQGIVGQALAFIALLGAFAYYCVNARQAHGPSAQYLSLVALLAIGLGATFTIMWKLTIEGHTGSIAISDAPIFAGWYYSLKSSLYPFYNLGSEGEISLYGYFNNLHSFYALSLNFLPRFNIYLFNMASITTFYVLATAYMLHMMRVWRSSSGLKPLTHRNVVLVSLLFIVGIRYPTGLLESPPVAFMIPVTLTVVYAIARAGDNIVRLGVALAIAIVGSAISKVVTIVVLGSYAGVSFLQWIMRRATPVYFLFLGLLACLLTYYAVYMLKLFGPQFAPEWVPGPEFWPRFVEKGFGQFQKVIPKLLKDAGLVIVVYGALQLKNSALFVASVLAVATHFAFPFLFTPTPAAFLILIAGYILTVEDISRKAWIILLLGALAIVPHHFRHDPGNWHAMALWTCTLGTAVYITLHGNFHATSDNASKPNPRWVHVLWALALVVVTLTVLASGDMRIGKKKLELIPLTLNDIWSNTRLRTPENALIFTDQTDAGRARLRGWNDYSLMAQRQFYISTSSNGPLRYNRAALEEKLSKNSGILSGELLPTDLGLSRDYSSYFAVVESGRTVPDSFEQTYANRDFVLYQIKSTDK